MSRVSPPSSAVPWALVWMGGVALAAWVPVFMADQLHQSRSAAVLAQARRAALLPQQGLASRAAHSTTAPSDPLLQTPATAASPVRLAPTLATGSLSLPDRQGRAQAFDLPSAAPRLSPGRSASAMFPLPQATAALPASFSFSAQADPQTAKPLPGSILLGGPLGLESLREKLMVPSARSERAQHAAASDRFQALPLHWRQHLQWLTGTAKQILPAEVVRVPAPHLKRPEAIPLAVSRDGMADTTVQPSSAKTKQALERWAARQPRLADGQMRPVLVVLEPLDPVVPVDAAAATGKAREPRAGNSAMTSLSSRSLAPESLPVHMNDSAPNETAPPSAHRDESFTSLPAVSIAPPQGSIPASALHSSTSP